MRAPDSGHNGVVDPVDPSRARRPRRVVRLGAEQAAVGGMSSDETPQGWGDGTGEDTSDSNDERLRRDVPPHY